MKQSISPLIKIRLALARWILGKHCGCYAMGYHKLCDYSKKKVVG